MLSNHLFSFFFGSIRIREKGRIVIFLFFSFFLSFTRDRKLENWAVESRWWNHGRTSVRGNGDTPVCPVSGKKLEGVLATKGTYERFIPFLIF